ncbi:MAG: hypothetical protein PHI47_01875 [Sulfuricurvum sp.]|uniref:hypothetical protein n=1 Tax=Sulfuricurvum sp. TaxID=2025608 RepID=UPI00261DADBA|nr:hypothetical protein [Sulfuricurvum sp.]MDD5158772.1 hypothetical protein [Sulfuricurvum sp.]
MNVFSSMIERVSSTFRCFGKRRYGYVDRSSSYIPAGHEALVMILSPDLYRISIASLPVATAKEAVRYAESYFDVSDERTRYGAYFIGEGRYLLSAFDPEPTRKCLEEAGIDPSSVERFVLAQEAFGSDNLPVSLADGSVLALSEGIVVRLPSHYINVPIQQTIEEALKTLAPCLRGFTADMYVGGEATKKTLLFTVVLSSLVVLNLLIQGVLSYREAQQITDAQEQMNIEKHLPATQMELDSLAASWEKKEAEQIKLRKIVAAFGTLSLESNKTVSISTLPSSSTNGIVLVPGSKPGERNLLLVPGDTNTTIGTVSGEYVTSLAYENGLVTFKILTPSQERAEKIQDSVSKTLKTDTVTIKENSVEGSIQ